jgi:3-deoxy-D-manno-octulosonate 8-phosphate phosphatase (KDO 8-P phosphatase)
VGGGARVTALSADLRERASRIRVLLFDVDGVLTDGGLYLGHDGTEFKRFDIKDGAGIVQARMRGLVTGLLSARTSAATSHRAAQLGMSPVLQGVSDKAAALTRLSVDEQWPLETIAYMGDDVLDVPVLVQVGLASCPADAVDAVRRVVHWVSPHAGGRGAVRSLVDLVLEVQDQATPQLPVSDPLP